MKCRSPNIDLIIQADVSTHRFLDPVNLVDIYWTIQDKEKDKSVMNGVLKFISPSSYGKFGTLPLLEVFAAIYICHPSAGGYLKKYANFDILDEELRSYLTVSYSLPLSMDLTSRKLFNVGDAEQNFRRIQGWKNLYQDTDFAYSFFTGVDIRCEDRSLLFQKIVIENYDRHAKSKSFYEKTHAINKPQYCMKLYNVISRDNIVALIN